MSWLEWSPALAEALAAAAGIERLTAEHWMVLTFCREEVATAHRVPDAARICAATGLSARQLGRLFRSFRLEPAVLAARVAGLGL